MIFQPQIKISSRVETQKKKVEIRIFVEKLFLFLMFLIKRWFFENRVS